MSLRHVGNDIVILIFKEPGQTYSPHTITSHFIRMFLVSRNPNLSYADVTIVIEPVEFENKTYYRYERNTRSAFVTFVQNRDCVQKWNAAIWTQNYATSLCSGRIFQKLLASQAYVNSSCPAL